MRIVGIDVLRSIAILLAMFSHIYAETGLGQHLPPEISIPFRIVLQMATPVFVMLFGTMLELVYFPRWVSGQRKTVTARLLKRALQCWVLYALSIFCLFLVDDGYSLKFSISCLLFMGNSPYTEILKFYAVALALAPLLLRIRERIGLAPLVAIALAYQAAWPLLHAMPDAHEDLGIPLQVARLIKFLGGFGSPLIAGPSILHGFTLIIFGLCLGWFVSGNWCRTREEKASLASRIVPALAVALVLTLAGALMVPGWVFHGLSNMNLRMDSHVVYFATGTVSALCLTLASIWIVDIRMPGRSAMWRRLSFFGRTSMFTFAWGNMLLYLVDYQPSGSGTAFGMAVLLLAAICLMSFVFDLIMRRSDLARAMLESVNRPLDWLACLSPGR